MTDEEAIRVLKQVTTYQALCWMPQSLKAMKQGLKALKEKVAREKGEE